MSDDTIDKCVWSHIMHDQNGTTREDAFERNLELMKCYNCSGMEVECHGYRSHKTYKRHNPSEEI